MKMSSVLSGVLRKAQYEEGADFEIKILIQKFENLQIKQQNGKDHKLDSCKTINQINQDQNVGSYLAFKGLLKNESTFKNLDKEVEILNQEMFKLNFWFGFETMKRILKKNTYFDFAQF